VLFSDGVYAGLALERPKRRRHAESDASTGQAPPLNNVSVLRYTACMTTRLPIVGGNWKMNTDLASAVELAEDIVADCDPYAADCDVVLFPPFPYLQAVGKALGHHRLALGAQDVYHESNGAYTGEVSCDMLTDLHATYVIIGHSERRHVIGETDELINAKVLAALRSELNVILCVGETDGQRQAGQTERINVDQVTAGLRGVTPDHMRQVVIAYEPVWAIGTGKTATPEDAQAVHELIRGTIGDLYDGAIAAATRIQYGGSVKPSNASDLFAQPDIDGGLIGGASLKAGDFTAIVKAAAEVMAAPSEST